MRLRTTTTTRTTTTRATATVAALATATLVLGFAPAAFAQPFVAATVTTCIPANGADGVSASTTKSKKAKLAAIDACIAQLTKQADAAGRAAQIADERYLKAKAAAAASATAAQAAAAAASAAAAKAQESRDREAAVAAYMARTGQSDQATSVMLDGTSAAKTLYTLSRVSQLTVDSSQIAYQAAVDSATAKQLGTAAADAALLAAQQASDAHAAYKKAKSTATASAQLVGEQLSQEQAIAAQFGVSDGTTSSSAASTLTDLPADASKAARVVAFARAQIGDPYVFAAAGPNAWDCSGLTMGAYASVGIGIGGHSATAQYDLARSQGKLVLYADAKPGDLIFYTDGGGDMYHVTIYSGNGMMIEAPQEGEDVREVAVRPYQMMPVVARPTA